MPHKFTLVLTTAFVVAPLACQENEAEPRETPELRNPDIAVQMSEPSPGRERIDAGAGDLGALPDAEVVTEQCDVALEVEPSPAIPTVGIAEFTSPWPELESAVIEFGPTTDYGSRVDAELDAPNFRTLLLGLPPLREHHVRVTLSDGQRRCQSPDLRFVTGPDINGFPTPTVTVTGMGEVAPGFMVTARHTGTDVGQLYILNEVGERVWAYETSVTEIARVRMSYDAQYMLAGNTNVAGTNGRITRVRMDGLEEEVMEIPTFHHDFVALPKGDLALIAKADDGCDEILRLSTAGESTHVFSVRDAYPEGAAIGGEREACHTNSIQYYPEDDTFTFSDLANNAYVKITALGEVVWVLGGPFSDFSGGGAEWERQHGHRLLTDNRLLFFNNGSAGLNVPSLALEVRLDFEDMTASRVFRYEANQSSSTFGDVQRLSNGNTLVTYSNAGEVHQVDGDGNLVQLITFSFGGATGYTEFRPSLYGPPPG